MFYSNNCLNILCSVHFAYTTCYIHIFTCLYFNNVYVLCAFVGNVIMLYSNNLFAQFYMCVNISYHHALKGLKIKLVFQYEFLMLTFCKWLNLFSKPKNVRDVTIPRVHHTVVTVYFLASSFPYMYVKCLFWNFERINMIPHSLFKIIVYYTDCPSPRHEGV